MSTGQLKILCWEGYEDAALLGPFSAEHDITAFGETLVSDYAAAHWLASGANRRFDVVNINNPFVRDYLHPRGLIRPLDRVRFEPCFERMLPQFQSLYGWASTRQGGELIGVCQRFGPFNLVVNTQRVSRDVAEDQGFLLVNDSNCRERYGILSYDDFNVMHICIGAGLDPFVEQDGASLDAFAATARRWFEGAKLVTSDHLTLNKALIDGDIDFYLSGGVYTASPARLAGHHNIRAVTPRHGPIDGKGAIVFMEITSVLDHPGTSPHAEDFLDYMLRPEVATAIAFAEGTSNPVAQMGDPRVMAAFSKSQLEAIQWETLEEDVARSAEYAIAPSYEALHVILAAAKREFGWS